MDSMVIALTVAFGIVTGESWSTGRQTSWWADGIGH